MNQTLSAVSANLLLRGLQLGWKFEPGCVEEFRWCGKRGSNPRPQRWQRCALPAELFPQAYTFCPRSIQLGSPLATHDSLASAGERDSGRGCDRNGIPGSSSSRLHDILRHPCFRGALTVRNMKSGFVVRATRPRASPTSTPRLHPKALTSVFPNVERVGCLRPAGRELRPVVSS